MPHEICSILPSTQAAKPSMNTFISSLWGDYYDLHYITIKHEQRSRLLHVRLYPMHSWLSNSLRPGMIWCSQQWSVIYWFAVNECVLKIPLYQGIGGYGYSMVVCMSCMLWRLVNNHTPNRTYCKAIILLPHSLPSCYAFINVMCFYLSIWLVCKFEDFYVFPAIIAQSHNVYRRAQTL